MLITAWDFGGAGAGEGSVRRRGPSQAAGHPSPRSKLLAALKTRLIENIKSADPRYSKLTIGLRGSGGQVTGADEHGITTTLNLNGQEQKHAWAEYGERSTLRPSPLERLLRSRNRRYQGRRLRGRRTACPGMSRDAAGRKVV